MRDPDTFTVDDPRFSTGRVVGRSMLTVDGAEHRRHRDPFARPFRRDAVLERFTPVVEAQVARLIDAIEPAGRAELRRGFAGPLAAGVVAAMLVLVGAYMAAAERWAAGISGPAYAIDDETAIKVVGDAVEVVSEGHWKLLTP
jgi:cytochrome P450